MVRLRHQLQFHVFRFGLIVLILPLFAFAAVSESEPNDDFSDANPVQCGDTVFCAVLSEGDLDHFRFLAPAGDSLYLRTLSCAGSATNTLLVLLDENQQILATDNGSGPADFSVIRYWTNTSQFMTVRVMSGGSSTDSTYHLLIECRTPMPENYDYCDAPRVANQLPYYNEGDTWGKADDAGTPAPDVFYLFSQPTLSDVSIEVCSEFFDARIQLIGFCLGNFMDDASVGCLQGATLLVFSLQPGDYYVMVEGVSAGESGEFNIVIEPTFPECLPPPQVVLYSVGGQPFLDWPEVPDADYFIIYQSSNADGPFEHLDVSFESFYTDPAGFTAATRFYQVVTVCPWSN